MLLFNNVIATHTVHLGAEGEADHQSKLQVERQGPRQVTRALLDLGGGPGQRPHVSQRVLPADQEAGAEQGETGARLHHPHIRAAAQPVHGAGHLRQVDRLRELLRHLLQTPDLA